MAKDKSASFLQWAGGALVLAAALLTGFNLYSEAHGDAQASQTAAALRQITPSRTQSEAADSTTAEQMQTVTIDGEEYVGTLDIPAAGLSLPVNNSLSSARLKKSPCRYEGSFLTDDFIIAGHNYRHGFGRLKRLNVGDSVVFTDVDGYAYYYEVSEIEQIGGRDVAGMEAGDWDLTLFTCTPGGAKRLTMRCRRIAQGS